jgi:hypothetical protein
MTGGKLAQHLGDVSGSLGIIEGFARAMRESVLRELGTDHFSNEFNAKFEAALIDIRDSLTACYEAVDDLPRGVDSEE